MDDIRTRVVYAVFATIGTAVVAGILAAEPTLLINQRGDLNIVFFFVVILVSLVQFVTYVYVALGVASSLDRIERNQEHTLNVLQSMRKKLE